MAAKAKKSLDDYTKRDLYTLAKKANIPGRGTMSKGQLFEALGLGSAKAAAKPAAKVSGITAAPSGGPEATSAPAAAPPAQAAPGGYVERGGAIPDTYGDDKLVALVRDPHWVFCYWELEGGACQRIIDERGKALMDSAKWIIRAHRTALGSHADTGVDPGVRNWYLKVEPETRYRFEIGILTPDGEFLAVASSAEVETPREGLSDDVDEQWMLVREDLERLIQAMGGVEFGVPGSAMGRRFELPKELARSSGGASGRDPRR